MLTRHTLLLFAAFCFFVVVAVAGFAAEVKLNQHERLQDYLPGILVMCLEGFVIVVLIGWLQLALEKDRKRRLLNELTHHLALAGSVIQNFTYCRLQEQEQRAGRQGGQGRRASTEIDFRTYASSYESMRALRRKGSEPGEEGTGDEFLSHARRVAAGVRTPAQRHWRRLRALASVPVEFGEANVAEWLEVTDKLYNIALYAEAAEKAGNDAARDDNAKRAYDECGALFCLLGKMEIPGYETPEERRGTWGK